MSNLQRTAIAATVFAAPGLGALSAEAQTALGLRARRRNKAGSPRKAVRSFKAISRRLGSAQSGCAKTQAGRAVRRPHETGRTVVAALGRTAANNRSVPLTTFKPSGSSATFEMLADSIASNQTEREGLLLVFNARKRHLSKRQRQWAGKQHSRRIDLFHHHQCNGL